jgi:methanol--5-hydroxybenzimidazolylcobamide Co-methyltransferase
VAYECGAVGPGKDCGYENPILKAITGFPMSMEGKMATCAHLSPLGNIPAATCDLWSNESVQNIKLLGDMAPVCSFEQLEYDCRLMNRAALDGDRGRTQLRDWLVSADANLDPQAFILTPENCVAFAKTIVEAPDHYTAGRNAAAEALAILRQAVAEDELVVPEQEVRYLDLMEASIETMPDSESEFIDAVMPMLDTSRFRPEEYDLV